MAMAMSGSCCCNSALSVAWRPRLSSLPRRCRQHFQHEDERSALSSRDRCAGSAGTSATSRGVNEIRTNRCLVDNRRGKYSRLLVQAADSKNEAADVKNGAAESGDQVLRCVSTAAEVSILTLVATDVVHEAQRRHKASPTASAALGRALMGTLLLGAMKGPSETVQITFQGQGPLGQMMTVASGANLVKGFVGNPLCQTPLKSSGKLDVGSAVGTGVLTVVRTKANRPYSGTIPIYSGEVAEDIAHYLADSEQLNVALGLGVSFNRDTSVKFAGGFLVQVLPFCSDETLATLENNILTMPPLSDSEGTTAQDITEHILKDIGVGDYSDLPSPQFGPCTVEDLKPRMVRAVASLGSSDIKELLKEQGHVEVKCEFCAEVVRFGEADLQDILQPK